MANNSNSSYTPPGRIGDPNLSPATDPRINPKLLAALTAFGLDKTQDVSALPSPKDFSIEALTPIIAASEKAFTALYNGLDNTLPTDAHEPSITISETTIKGIDNNDIKLLIYKPATASPDHPLPAILYSHGGGMVFIPTDTRVHRRWLHSLAVNNVIAIGVDFRNAFNPDGTYSPFPAGLNDCAAAAKYLAAHRRELGIAKLITHGESGGGNLAITTALKAKREGWLEGAIDGVFADVPYISNAYGWEREKQLRLLPSLVENDGFLMATGTMAAYGFFYGVKDAENPHAWPYHESVENLRGLCPVHLSMDELDPLRDEGLDFYRKLGQAGVSVTAEVKLGLMHGSELFFRQAIPEAHQGLARSVAGFANKV